ncbi:phage protein Gp36 family protein [Ornithobacterium rhinotracheale]|uniref:phage protein Gp36 family protein n=1 Tax=Ornithobacterium rhinotracheale TaxID=28251 RepID=UPI001FF3AA3B|nr:phage protein Gp36 family protein [Ornithobacterium rhinotracheale]MCK0199225.1 DUF1320 family protein [Ornithobacterium rhinotracheale]MCK0200266.1 DUF1320 family protein [Ornithobacterium rhinotracheale]MCK0200538.1 DUF1320 family protein [Ornithobacterium rhinotracheale]
MSYINYDDYTALVRDEIKSILLENHTDAKLSAAEQMGITQVRNYLAGRYDVDKIFAATGLERNSHLVMIIIDCTLYHLYTSVIPDRMPDIRSQRYQDALDWLKMVANGDAIADLPKITDSNGDKLTGIKITSKYETNNHRW